jgi:DNA-binding MarR family transcriptional regulator
MFAMLRDASDVTYLGTGLVKATKPAITRAADRFEAESLIERRETKDGRVPMLVLTAKGRRIMRTVEGS